MRILMLSRDANIFKDGSAVAKRMVKYGTLCDELRIIVFVHRLSASKQLTDNVWIYPFWDILEVLKNLDTRLRGYDKGSENNRKDWIVTTQDPFEVGLIGWLIKIFYRTPLEIQIHTDFLSLYFWRESFKNKIRVILAKFLIKRADKIRVVSERIRKSLIDLNINENKITVLPIAVDAQKISEAPIKTDLHKKYPQFDFIILMASRFSREKNIELAIDVFGEIITKYPKALLLIVGEGPLHNNLQFTINNLHLEKNIIIEDWTDDLVSYYKTADLFLLTSNYEGYGMSVMEAKIAGCPIVMTDVGVASEELKSEKNVSIVPVNDQLALIKAIIMALAKA